MAFEIDVGEKFASWVFSACDLRLPDALSTVQVWPGLWVSRGDELPFKLDDWWRDQLGSLVVENLERGSSFCLTAKQASNSPRLLDAEIPALERRVWLFAWGVVLSAGTPHFDIARIVSGGRGEEGFQLKLSTPEHFVRSGGLPAPTARIEDFKRAARFAVRVQSIERERESDIHLYWRALSGFDAFTTAVKSQLAHVKLHQFVRAIESFLPTDASGELRFAEYCMNFCPANGTQLREIYRLRNMSEHHRPFLHAVESATIADQRLRQSDLLCRDLFRRLFADFPGFETHFRDGPSLKHFWKDRNALAHAWGERIDLGAMT